MVCIGMNAPWDTPATGSSKQGVRASDDRAVAAPLPCQQPATSPVRWRKRNGLDNQYWRAHRRAREVALSAKLSNPGAQTNALAR
jgi:hypothetical protein